MVEESTASRSVLKPVLGGILLLVALVAAIYFRAEVWEFLKLVGRQIRFILTDWIPDHPGQAAVTLAFIVLAFAINWIAHVRGRLRAWIFAVVFELGLWVVFWYGAVVIPPLNEMIGLNVEQMTLTTVLVSGLVIFLITGAIFWFLESKEEWNKYRRRHHVDED
jgi:hypothetical protein